MSETDVQQINMLKTLLGCARDEVERLTAERNRALAQRDAQVREAFLAGRAALYTGHAWTFINVDSSALDQSAFAAFQARPSSGTGSGEQEQS